MSVIRLNLGNCQNCYKCIRHCPLKAIAFKEGHVNIIDEECVLCGTCVECCPQNARFIKNDTDKVQEMLRSGQKVYISLAPSWEGYFDGVAFEQLSAACKKLGFAGVEETAIGASEVSREYAALLKNGQMENIIGTACPSVVMMVEKHYPELIPMLSPVVSPMMAHANLMRKLYGDIKVVFIGPCLSKMEEIQDPLAGGTVDCALTFSFLEQWLHEEKIGFDQKDTEAVGVKNPVARLYPKPAGILKTIPDDDYGSYTRIAVDGIERCMRLFEWIRDEKVTGLFVEANLCTGGCVGGPVMRMNHKSMFKSELMINEQEKARDHTPAQTALTRAHYGRVFADRSPKNVMPTEEQIKEILAKTGKTSPEQELNCGSCGYSTCRDKAIAVFQGKADVNMCLPFFRQRAESISNTVIEHSPNGIIAFDRDQLVVDMNPTAEHIFGVKRADVVGGIMPEFIGDITFDEAQRTDLPIVKRGLTLQNGTIVEQTTVYIKENGVYIMLIKDITQEQKDKESLEKMRLNTVEIAQNVINNQMRVAQEIASLLGETTAETKVALTNLKKSMTETGEA